MTDQFKLYKYFWNLYKSVCICFRRKLCGIASWKRRSIETQHNANRIHSLVVDFIECYLVKCANTGQITDNMASFRRRIEMNGNMQCHTMHQQNTTYSTSWWKNGRRRPRGTRNNSIISHKAPERTKNPFWLDVFVIYRIQNCYFQSKQRKMNVDESNVRCLIWIFGANKQHRIYRNQQ